MGLYDTVYVPVKCPFCEAIITDGQTKDLDNMLNNYEIGDCVTDKLKYIEVLYDCVNSLKCISKVIRKNGSFNGFGTFFDVNVMIVKQKISSHYIFKNKNRLSVDNNDSINEALLFLEPLDEYHIDLILNLNEKDLDTVKTYLDSTYGCV